MTARTWPVPFLTLQSLAFSKMHIEDEPITSSSIRRFYVQFWLMSNFLKYLGILIENCSNSHPSKPVIVSDQVLLQKFFWELLEVFLKAFLKEFLQKFLEEFFQEFLRILYGKSKHSTPFFTVSRIPKILPKFLEISTKGFFSIFSR